PSQASASMATAIFCLPPVNSCHVPCTISTPPSPETQTGPLAVVAEDDLDDTPTSVIVHPITGRHGAAARHEQSRFDQLLSGAALVGEGHGRDPRVAGPGDGREQPAGGEINPRRAAGHQPG